MTNVQIKLTEFSDLITRYTADFVGREWLVEQVNALLDDPDCGFVMQPSDLQARKPPN